jgi:hypothetical protein
MIVALLHRAKRHASSTMSPGMTRKTALPCKEERHARLSLSPCMTNKSDIHRYGCRLARLAGATFSVWYVAWVRCERRHACVGASLCMAKQGDKADVDSCGSPLGTTKLIANGAAARPSHSRDARLSLLFSVATTFNPPSLLLFFSSCESSRIRPTFARGSDQVLVPSHRKPLSGGPSGCCAGAVVGARLAWRIHPCSHSQDRPPPGLPTTR